MGCVLVDIMCIACQPVTSGGVWLYFTLSLTWSHRNVCHSEIIGDCEKNSIVDICAYTLTQPCGLTTV